MQRRATCVPPALSVTPVSVLHNAATNFARREALIVEVKSFVGITGSKVAAVKVIQTQQQ